MRLIDADELCLGKFVEPRTEWHQGWNDALDAATTQALTIDAVPVVHGRWIEGKTLEKCSVCGKKGFSDWHYCPNCGAKMKGE